MPINIPPKKPIGPNSNPGNKKHEILVNKTDAIMVGYSTKLWSRWGSSGNRSYRVSVHFIDAYGLPFSVSAWQNNLDSNLDIQLMLEQFDTSTAKARPKVTLYGLKPYSASLFNFTRDSSVTLEDATASALSVVSGNISAIENNRLCLSCELLTGSAVKHCGSATLPVFTVVLDSSEMECYVYIPNSSVEHRAFDICVGACVTAIAVRRISQIIAVIRESNEYGGPEDDSFVYNSHVETLFKRNALMVLAPANVRSSQTHVGGSSTSVPVPSSLPTSRPETVVGAKSTSLTPSVSSTSRGDLTRASVGSKRSYDSEQVVDLKRQCVQSTEHSPRDSLPSESANASTTVSTEENQKAVSES